jgi:hypothetical protein
VYRINSDKINVSYNPYYSQAGDKNFKVEPKEILKLSRDIKLGYIGDFSRKKGSRDLSLIMSQLRDNKFRWIIAGSIIGNNEVKRFRKLLENDYVEYRGVLNHVEVLRLYAEIDALIFLSYHEGSPRVLREFEPTGKPIFAYYNPGIDYLSDLPGIWIYPYGRYDLIVRDLLNEQIFSYYEREIPDFVKKNGLKPILFDIKKNFDLNQSW